MRGGLELLAHKDRSTQRPLTPVAPPTLLTLVIKGSDPSILAVGQNESVLLGQPVTHRSPFVHAPVSGLVENIDAREHHLTLTIRNDGRDSPHGSVVPSDYQTLTPEEIRSHLAEAGIVGLGGASFTTATKVRAAAERHSPLLIINGAECEPFVSCDDILMRTHAREIIIGTQVLLAASGASSAVIAIESNKPEAIAAVTRALSEANDSRIGLSTVLTRYPAGGERQLVKLLTGNEVPSGGIPPDIGVLVHNVATAWAVERLMLDGIPAIDRVVTVTGSGVAHPTNVLARFGTPIAELIRACGGYTADVDELVMGGSMMGVSLNDDATPVSAATNCIIAATKSDFVAREPEMPCIRCGNCADVCPAHLLPQQLLRYARMHDHSALTEYGLSDCIECGSCDYVCPSHITLTSAFIAAKHA